MQTLQRLLTSCSIPLLLSATCGSVPGIAATDIGSSSQLKRDGDQQAPFQVIDGLELTGLEAEQDETLVDEVGRVIDWEAVGSSDASVFEADVLILSNEMQLLKSLSRIYATDSEPLSMTFLRYEHSCVLMEQTESEEPYFVDEMACVGILLSSAEKSRRSREAGNELECILPEELSFDMAAMNFKQLRVAMSELKDLPISTSELKQKGAASLHSTLFMTKERTLIAFDHSFIVKSIALTNAVKGKRAVQLRAAVTHLNDFLGLYRDVNGTVLPEKQVAEKLEQIVKQNRYVEQKERWSHSQLCPEVFLHELTEEIFFTNYVARNRPVLIRQSSSVAQVPEDVSLPASIIPALIERWSLKYLADQFGEEVVSVRAALKNEAGIGVFEGVEDEALWTHATMKQHRGKKVVQVPEYVRNQLVAKDKVLVRPAIVDIKFKDMVQYLIRAANKSQPTDNQSTQFSNISLYVEYLHMDQNFALLMESTDIASPQELKKGPRQDQVLEGSYLHFARMMKRFEESRNIWLGDGKTVGKLHFDPLENLLTMIKGSKTFTIFDSSLSPAFQEGHIRETRFQYDKSTGTLSRTEFLQSTSIVNSAVDLASNRSEILEGSKLVCKVNAGDVLYLPAFWWHEVDSEGARDESTGHPALVNLAVSIRRPGSSSLLL